MNIQRPASTEPLSNSLFHMWRCVIAIAHADGKVDAAERAYIETMIGNLGRTYVMTDAQRQTLLNDLATAQEPADMLQQIEDPAIRSQVLYFCGILAHADGEKCSQEEAILKKLHAKQMAKLDMDTLRREIHRTVENEMMAIDERNRADKTPLQLVLETFLAHISLGHRLF